MPVLNQILLDENLKFLRVNIMHTVQSEMRLYQYIEDDFLFQLWHLIISCYSIETNKYVNKVNIFI